MSLTKMSNDYDNSIVHVTAYVGDHMLSGPFDFVQEYISKEYKVYKSWSHLELYKRIIITRRDNDCIELKTSYIIPAIHVNAIRNEFLIPIKGDEEKRYEFNKDAAIYLTDERLDTMFDIMGRMSRKHFHGKYELQYISKTNPSQIISSIVEVNGQKFIGVDGKKHRTVEPGCKLIQWFQKPDGPQKCGLIESREVKLEVES